MIAVALIAIGLLGGIALGGIFTLVLVPLGLIAIVSGIAHAVVTRSAATSTEAADTTRPERPLRTSQPRDSGHVPTDPEALVNARREQQ